MSDLHRSVGTALGVVVGAVLCIATPASAENAAREEQEAPVQQAALAPPSAIDTCFKGETLAARRITACSDAIGSGELRGSELPRAHLARAAAYTAIGDEAHAAKDNRQAATGFEAIMDVEAPDPTLLFLCGTAYHALGEADAALADYDLAIRLSPQSAIVFIDRGIVLSAYKHEYTLAIMDFDRALTLSPNNRAALAWRAEAEAKSRDGLHASPSN